MSRFPSIFVERFELGDPLQVLADTTIVAAGQQLFVGGGFGNGM